MDYEKAYKKALETARKINSGEGVAAPPDWTICEVIFPELKESEDEKIRKELIQFIKNWKNPNNIGRTHDFPTLTRNVEQCDRYIAWLEKQGDTNETINRDEFAQGVLRGAAINLITWIDYKAYEGSMCLSNMECKDIEDALVSGDWDKIYAYIKKKLEKQDEQKSKWSDDDEQYLLVCKNALRKYQVSDKWDADIISKWLEDKLKQGEQKPKWTDHFKKNIVNMPFVRTVPFPECYLPGGVCSNPHRDCINCPRIFDSGGTTITTTDVKE